MPNIPSGQAPREKITSALYICRCIKEKSSSSALQTNVVNLWIVCGAILKKMSAKL